MQIIALGHKAQQGKTWAANFLASALPGRTLVWGFGDGIKAVARATEGMGLRKEPKLLQRIGQAYRDDDPYVWIKVWHGVVHDQLYVDRVIVPDMRYRNEARFLREQMGATLIKLVRFHPGTTKPWVADDRWPNHPSEVDLDKWDEWDHIVETDSTREVALKLTAIVKPGSLPPPVTGLQGSPGNS